jgi:hypothetical protein
VQGVEIHAGAREGVLTQGVGNHGHRNLGFFESLDPLLAPMTVQGKIHTGRVSAGRLLRVQHVDLRDHARGGRGGRRVTGVQGQVKRRKRRSLLASGPALPR